MVNVIEVEVEKSDDAYEQTLNEIYGEVTICGQTFDARTVYKKLDPIGFRCGKADEEIEYRYSCGECGEEYDSESDAEDCCYDASDGCDNEIEESEEK